MSLQVNKPYSILTLGISQSLKHIEECNYGLAKDTLIKAQIDAEEEFLSADEFVYNETVDVYKPDKMGKTAEDVTNEK